MNEKKLNDWIAIHTIAMIVKNIIDKHKGGDIVGKEKNNLGK